MNLTNVDILRMLHAELTKLVEVRWKGRLSVAGDLAEVLEMLVAAPAGVLVVMEWAGEDSASEDPYTGVVAQNLGVYVAKQTGLAVRPEAPLWLTRPAPNNPTLLERVNEVRDFLRGLLLPESATDRYLNYRGCQQVADGQGAPMHAYRLSFQIHAALPEVEYRPLDR